MSLVEKLAERFDIDPTKLMQAVTERALPKGASAADAMAALMICHEHGLNPLTGEVFVIATKAGMKAVVSVDGWARIVNENPAFDGVEFDYHEQDGELQAVTCRIWRNDRSRPISVTEYMAECKRNTEPWLRWPRRMLRHKAFVQCARLAFSLAGLIDPDEAERFEDAGAVVNVERESRLAAIKGSGQSENVLESGAIDVEQQQIEVEDEVPESDT